MSSPIAIISSARFVATSRTGTATARRMRVSPSTRTRIVRVSYHSLASRRSFCESLARHSRSCTSGSGVEAEEPPDPEVQLRLWRASDSQKLLREAKEWYETLTIRVRVDGETRIRRAVAVPVLEVATKRADEMMAIGDDTSVPLTVRADAYSDAQDYYAIADDQERTDLAYQKQVALEPELDAYRDKREAALKKAAEQGKGMAAEMERAVEDMEKTEEEKEAFKEEADALEDELGF